jgi:hypothetical protein
MESVVGTSRYAPRAMRYLAKALIADRCKRPLPEIHSTILRQ